MMTNGLPGTVIAQNNNIIVSGNLKLETIMITHDAGIALIADFASKHVKAINISMADVIKSDSSGLSLLLSWLRAANKYNITLSISDMPQYMLNIAKLSALDTVLPLG